MFDIFEGERISHQRTDDLEKEVKRREKTQKRLNRLFGRVQAMLPEGMARALNWLISPGAVWVRLPIAFLFVIGGIFSFLPILGIWMLPLGILLIAVDVPVAAHWVVSIWPQIERWWRRRQRRRNHDEGDV